MPNMHALVLYKKSFLLTMHVNIYCVLLLVSYLYVGIYFFNMIGMSTTIMLVRH